jgi:trigger factor
MQVFKKELGKGKFELTVEITPDELKSSVTRAVEKLSEEVKIEGFRPGKATYEVLAKKITELAIWEEVARLAINKNLDKILLENLERQAVGQPQINITKLAPDNPLEFTIQVSVLPEVTLGTYKDLNFSLPEVKVEEVEVEKILTELREMRVVEAISEEALGETDKALVDIQMYLDKVPVEGGQGQGVAITMGKDFVVPGFDQKIKGMKKGDVREFDLHFPAEHYQKNLADKMVEFKVTLKEVYKRELPALTEELALTFGQKSIEDLKNILTDNVKHEKLQKEEQKLEVEILEKIAAATRFGDIPEELVTNEAHSMLHELEHNLEHQGANMTDYLASLKKSKEELMLDMMPEAMKRVKIILAIREVGVIEKLVVTEEEVEAQLEQIQKQYEGNKEVEAKVKTTDYKGYVRNSLANQKIVNSLKAWNIKK